MVARRRPEKPKIFVSHIADESALASIFKKHLSRDFIGILEIFVSTDESSISAGSVWLTTVNKVLNAAKLEIVLCSRASVSRPWISFEAGAGWIRGIPIVPVCHTGLRPAELSMPFSVLQSIEANQEQGVKKLYRLIAEAIGCEPPRTDFEKLLVEIKEFEAKYLPQIAPLTRDANKRKSSALSRMKDELRAGRFRIRTMEVLAVVGGISEEEALDILRDDPEVVFVRTKSGKSAAKLKTR